MIDRKSRLPIKRQCRILGLARSTPYYSARPVSDDNLALMRRLDELHLELPFAGARMLRDVVRQEGRKVGRGRVGRLMRRMGMRALYRRPSTTKRDGRPGVFPYLLQGLTIDRPNQAWAADITYIPMRRGFVYLFAVMDWASRRVLAWRMSNTLSTDFCLEAVNEAIRLHGCPEIFNTDQGCQFTRGEFVSLLQGHGIKIRMDGKGSWRDNVFVERLWRTIKYEEVYLRAYEDVATARRCLGKYIGFYNARRPHQALEGQTPDQMYWQPLAAKTLAP